MALHYAQANAMWRNTVYSKRWFSSSCFLEIISEFEYLNKAELFFYVKATLRKKKGEFSLSTLICHLSLATEVIICLTLFDSFGMIP